MSLPIGEAFSAEELERRFEALEIRPAHNPGHAFQIRVPRGWQPHARPEMEREVSAEALTPLAGWQAPEPEDEAPSIFAVQAAQLEREISAKSFLIQYALTQDLRVHHLRELSPAFADMVMERRIEGAPFLERVAALIEGDRAFVLSGLAYGARYPTHEQTFGAMVASFRVLARSASRTIEPWEELRLLDAIRLRHPAAFRPQLADGSDDAQATATLSGYDAYGAIGGMIHVGASRGAPLAVPDEHARVLRAIAPMGIAPSGEPTELPMEVEAPGLVGLGCRRYPALVEGNELEHEIWIALARTSDLVLRVCMTTPDQPSSFLHWAQNRRAFEIVLGTLELAPPA